MESRKAHWEQVYQNKGPMEVSWFQENPAQSLRLIEQCDLSRNDSIIDVGGGASRLIDHLLQRGYQELTVLDISATALEHAQHRLGELATQVQWIESDITSFTPHQPFTLWHDRAVFHFLTHSADRKHYLEALRKGLQPGGHLILAAFSPDGPNQCSGLDIVQYDRDKMIHTLGADFQLLEQTTEAHTTPGNAIQHFNYFHFCYGAP